MRMIPSALSAAALLLGTLAASAETLPAAHIYRLGPPARTASATTMEYFGGPVIASVKIEVVFWTAGVAATTQAGIAGFLGAMADSTYTDQLAQYSTNLTGVNGKPGTKQTIGRGRVAGTVTITPANVSHTLKDSAIRRELAHQIATGKLPQRDPNTLYMVYFPAGYTITLGGGASCSSFGAYHESSPGKVGSPNLFYAIEPDCGGGFAAQTVVSSHEFAEALSDAIPTPGSHPAFPQAWNDAGGNEIGDLCTGHNATLKAGTKSYAVQEVFSNATNACATGNFTSP